MRLHAIQRSFLALTASGLVAAASTAAAQTTYVAQNDLLVIEFESSTTPGGWNFSTSTPGYLGDGYIRWDGPDLFNSPGSQGVFSFDFIVDQPGNYHLSIRNRHEDPDPTEQNDVWVRMDGGPWVKTFSNMAGSVGSWTWESRFDFGHGNQPQANYNLSAGSHTIEYSGRSFGFKMDRMHLFLPGTPGAHDPNQPESPTIVGYTYCSANPNSTGAVSEIQGVGSAIAANNDLTLRVGNLPQNVFGIFVNSDQTGFTPNIGGTSANLCLGGSPGRFADILSTGSAGSIEYQPNLAQLPRPNGTVAVAAGETWHFQFWHRDGAGNANMSRGYTVTFE